MPSFCAEQRLGRDVYMMPPSLWRVEGQSRAVVDALRRTRTPELDILDMAHRKRSNKMIGVSMCSSRNKTVKTLPEGKINDKIYNNA